MKLTLEQIADWCSGELHAPDTNRVAKGYSIDSRTLAAGDLFFAVRGERMDGHNFIDAAYERGAVAAVVSRDWARNRVPANTRPSDTAWLVVDDPLKALQRLAAAVRRHWGKRVIAVTGSAGKTSTKEAIAAVLAARYKVLRSQGNLNNHFGLPLQLLRLEQEHEVAVIEMGMNHAGEIKALAEIAAPNWGVVTNVGMAHIENFADGITGVARAKYELVQALPSDGVVFLNCDDPYVSQFGRDFPGRVILFGHGPCTSLRVEHIENLGAEGMRFAVISESHRAQIHLHMMGEHSVSNALAALSVGLAAEVPLELGAKQIESLRAEARRGQVLDWQGAAIINDCYNSNPEALTAMIRTLAGMTAERRILVAGQMLELGAQSRTLHAACGKAAAQARVDVVVGVAGDANDLVEAARRGGAEAHFVETPAQAGLWLKENLRAGDAVLLKASRGVRLEQALSVLGLEAK